MSMTEIRTDLATRAAVDTTLQTYDRAPSTIITPCFYVGLPEEVDYVHTYGPTGSTLTFKCTVVVASVESDQAITQLDLYIDPQRGSKAMKVLLENLTVSNTAGMGWTEVVSAEFVVVTFGTVDYMAVEFEVRVNV